MATARHALGDRSVNRKADEPTKKLEAGGAQWAVKGDGDLDDIANLLGAMSITAKPAHGPTDASAAAMKVLEADHAKLKDTRGNTVELVRVQEEQLDDDTADGVDAPAGDFSTMLLSAKSAKVTQGKSMRKDVPNPLIDAGRDAASYLDASVQASDMWKALSLRQRSRVEKMLAHAIRVPTKREALTILDSMFCMAGEQNEERMRDMLPWVTGEF